MLTLGEQIVLEQQLSIQITLLNQEKMMASAFPSIQNSEKIQGYERQIEELKRRLAPSTIQQPTDNHQNGTALPSNPSQDVPPANVPIVTPPAPPPAEPLPEPGLPDDVPKPLPTEKKFNFSIDEIDTKTAILGIAGVLTLVLLFK